MSHPSSERSLSRLLRRQRAGDADAVAKIEAMARALLDEVRPEPDDLPEHVHVRRAILMEWRAMFAFAPGRADLLPVLVVLAERAEADPDLEVMAMYRSAEWSTLVDHRGPVESVLVSGCTSCGREYPIMGTSGFVDEWGLVCGACGAVTFVASWGRPDPVACDCGGVAVLDCPGCGSREARTLREVSPYEYFADHRLRRVQAG